MILRINPSLKKAVRVSCLPLSLPNLGPLFFILVIDIHTNGHIYRLMLLLTARRRSGLMVMDDCIGGGSSFGDVRRLDVHTHVVQNDPSATEPTGFLRSSHCPCDNAILEQRRVLTTLTARQSEYHCSLLT